MKEGVESFCAGTPGPPEKPSVGKPYGFEALWNPAVEEWGGCRALLRQSTEVKKNNSSG